MKACNRKVEKRDAILTVYKSPTEGEKDFH